MMFEFAPDNLTNEVYPQWMLSKVREVMRIPNQVGVVARIEDPNDTPRHKIDILGGAEMQIITGKSTRFDRFDAARGQVRGQVVTMEGKTPVPGSVIVRSTRNQPDLNNTKLSPEDYQIVKLRKGSFSAKLPDDVISVDAYYLPASGYADCWSKTLKLTRRKKPVRRPVAKRR
jgi:hypothetical protein